MLDRTVAPPIAEINDIALLRAKRTNLSNGIPVWLLNAGTQEVAKIEFLFCAGTRDQSQPLVASGVNDMLDEGTPTRSATEIAETLDYYGAFIESETSQDMAGFTLYTLNKHLEATLPIVEDALKNAAFPESEFGIYLANKKQKYLVDSEKVANLARREFPPLLFGKDHPYGTRATLEDFSRVDRGRLQEFHRNCYTAKRCSIIVSGKVNERHLQLLEKHFGGKDWEGQAIAKPGFSAPLSDTVREHTLLKPNAIQSAIRMGRLLFNKTHPDWHGMQVLNTVTGGYFGSRLMGNIREDKGYTYGIGSGLVSLWDGGYFVIATEVGAQVCTAALNEIYKELDILQNDLVPDEEMSLVRNYMTGTFLRSTDGPFALADRLKALLGYGLDYDYYTKFLHTIRTITPEELRELARKYFNKTEMVELVAGKR